MSLSGSCAAALGADHRAGEARIGLAELDFAGQHVVAGLVGLAGGAALGGGAVDVFDLEFPVGPVAVSVEFPAKDHLVDLGGSEAESFGSLGDVVVLLRHEVYLCSNCARISRGRGLSPLKSIIIKS